MDRILPHMSADKRDIETRLAGYIAAAGDIALPPAVAARTRLHLLDTLAAILSGRFLQAGDFAYRFVESEAAANNMSGGAATLLGDTRRASVEQAAFANAMAAHADETDDSHVEGRFHPGCGIIPAALAVAERVGAPSEALLQAIALGYDVGARATMALGYSNPKTTVFSTHAFGALFGAAAASGVLLRLDARQSEALLSFTVQQCSGLSYWNRDPDHVEKSFDFGGRAARNGVFAALLAEAGMTAPDRPLTGPRGYMEAYAEVSRPEKMVEALGERYEITRATIKKWSVGSPLQSVLDAVAEVFGGVPTPAERISSIELRLPSNRIHVVDDKSMPAVCAQHLVALATLRGKVGFAESHDSGLMRDPQVQALRAKVHLIADDDLSTARPERQSILTVVLADGDVRRHHAKVVRGTPDAPMTSEEVAAKAEDILAPLLPDGGAALISACLQSEFSMPELVAACRLRPDASTR